MALSREVRDAALRLLSDETSGLNPRLAAQFSDANVKLPMPGTGAQPGAPFIFNVPKSPNVLKVDMPVKEIEENSDLQYPCLLIWTPSARMQARNKITPGIFWGTITVNIRIYLAWLTTEPPEDNDFELPFDLLQRAMFECFNAGFRGLGQPNLWGDGIIYNGDISEVTRDRQYLSNGKRLWVRGTLYQATTMALD